MAKAGDAEMDVEGLGEANTVAAGTPLTAAEEQKQAGAFKRFLMGPFFVIIPPQYERITAAKAAKVEAKGIPLVFGNRGAPQRKASSSLHQEPGAGGPSPGRGRVSGSGGVAAAGGKEEALDEELPATGDDYLTRIKRIVLSPTDTDGVYGLTYDELVPLPFTVPKWHTYLLDVLAGTYSVAQATIVMFIAIYVENQEREWKDGPAYADSWLPLIRALIILYPCVTLILLVCLTVEYAVRKFMYFRMLSMRILVDWTNVKPWCTIFFWYFIATWVLMNVWAIYGVAKYYGKNGNEGVDPVSFGAFVILNLQTIQLLLYYYKLLTSELRLVSLNQIFERAPVEAQKLLEFTYVIEEQDLVDECFAFAAHSERAFYKRMANMLTCGLACQDWHEAGTSICFDIKRLWQRAANWVEVEANIAELRAEVEAEEAERQAKGGFASSRSVGGAGGPTTLVASASATPARATGPALAALPASPTAASRRSGGDGSSSSGGADANDTEAGTVAVEPGDVQLAEFMHDNISNDNDAANGQPSTANGGRPGPGPVAESAEQQQDMARPSPAPPPPPAALGPELGPDGRPLPRTLPKPLLSFCGHSPLHWLYRNSYGSLHSLAVSVMVHFNSWPFRPDCSFFRFMTVVQLCGVAAVGAIVVFGWFWSARSTNCDKAAKNCNQCLSVHERYFDSAEPLCTAMETAVAAIVASANGTWVDGGVVRERYCDWTCYGAFTTNSSSCPPPGNGFCPATCVNAFNATCGL